ncbi:hypothetical protein ACGFYV_24800 [Streptomyces sp. NPDC048297]|uniref:hypothetical protein n=1 Tax=Streptomyces sp. NPDC048297 TaxID=3365531 RepID=UPI00371B736A
MPVDTGAWHTGHAVHGGGGKVVVQADPSMRGVQCVATTPRSAFPIPPLSAVAVVLPAVVLVPGGRRTYDGTRRRGPPPSGRRLLLQVCVART